MLGSNLVEQLKGKGHQVWTAGRKSTDDFILDLGNPQPIQIDPDFSADILFHCAASFGDDTAEGIWRNISVNVAGCVQVIELCKMARVKHLVYAGTISSDPDSMDVGEELNSYGLSKAQAEQWLKIGMDDLRGKYCSIRFSQLWDDFGLCCSHQPWLGRVIAYASNGVDLNIPDSSGPRNFLHVDDAATLMLLSAEKGVGGIYPACHPDSIDMKLFAEKAFDLFNRGGQVKVDYSKTPFRKVNFSDDFTLYESLGYFPSLSLKKDLNRIKDSCGYSNFGPMDVL